MYIAYAALAVIYTALVFRCGCIYQGARDIESISENYIGTTTLAEQEAKWADTEAQFD
jgi:hypothetical protein